ncbi:MAG: hypothetical protein KatS3mg057_0343 [Herpetosiphonaceae bacterium]|nr:MAG: hypothetical protein KatS3mg057_0343 [Herpetosiphonaceae bacterium]
MGELVQVLVERLAGVEILTGQAVQAVTPLKHGYTLKLDNGSQLDAEALVLATPAYITARLVEPFDPALAAAHADIPYASTATVSLAYAEDRIPAPLDGFGYVIPNVEGGDVLACTWTSSKWEGRAPEGFALLRVYLGRYGSDVLQRSDEELLALAQAELKHTLNITATPQLCRIYRWPASMPQYTLGHPQRLAAIERRLATHPGLFVAGAAYRGVGIPDCIASGERAAEAVLACLA